ncbi:cyclin-dependent kinase 14 isoform X2, partial [Silurus meridionalis]
VNGKLVALKVIRLQEEEGTPFTAIREASLLKGLKHANIVLLHDIIHTKETLTLVFEYVHTDLCRYMDKHSGGLHPENVRLLRGLSYIHQRFILHRDLKPQNLLISESGELKLADFDFYKCHRDRGPPPSPTDGNLNEERRGAPDFFLQGGARSRSNAFPASWMSVSCVPRHSLRAGAYHFFPDLSRSWETPYAACAFSPQTLLYADIVGFKECGYGEMLRVKEMLADYLSSDVASLKGPVLTTRLLKATSALVGLARAKSVPSHTYSNEVVTLWYRPPDVLLGSTEYSTCLDMWGVGCIYIEMIQGVAAFPGMKDVQDQLERIFLVLGTPSEETWPGVHSLPHFKPGRFPVYSAKKLRQAWNKLGHVDHAEDLASRFLQCFPKQRVSAPTALQHDFFRQLPDNLRNLSDMSSIFTVPGLRLYPESDFTNINTHSKGASCGCFSSVFFQDEEKNEAL